MKGKVFASLLLVCLPWLAVAQSNDDLYFIPKKEKKAEKKERVGQAPAEVSNTTVYAAPGSAVVVKDAAGRTRDIDEYNRRYTSRDNTFSMKNDTLYVEEKPYAERGEWVNGFEGTQDDYEYAMRIVRFRSPRYAIPVSSPLYWDVVYGAYPSWQWNVYDDGLYAYVFPTYTNPLWWDWRWSWGVSGPYWGFGWGWHSPWYYSSWHSPYWYGGYWGGYWGPGWHHHHHYYPHYGGGGGWHSYGHTDFRPNRYRGYEPSRRNYVSSGTRISSRPGYGTSSVRRNTSSNIGRVVQSADQNRGYSVRPVDRIPSSTHGNAGTRTPVRGGNSGYVRPSTTVDRSGNSYNRPSTTRRSYDDTYNRNTSGTRNSYNSNTQRSTNRSSFSSGSGSSFNRGSMGGGSTRRSTGGGGSSRRR